MDFSEPGLFPTQSKNHRKWVLSKDMEPAVFPRWLKEQTQEKNDTQIRSDSNETHTFPKSMAALSAFPIYSGVSSCKEPVYERGLMLGRTAAFSPQGPTSILPGWMTSLICCIATSSVSCLFFLSTSSVKRLQWDVIRLGKGGLRCHFREYLLSCLYLQLLPRL